MTECIICECEFQLSQSKKKRINQYHSSTKEGDKNYMCEDCFLERANSEYRMHNGTMLCAKVGCARNCMALSKYCEICENENNYQ
jgi:hypothetical protein